MGALLNTLFASWKTTLAGVGAAVAGYLGQQGSAGWQIVSMVLMGLLGVFAKDSNVTGGTVPTNLPTKL